MIRDVILVQDRCFKGEEWNVVHARKHLDTMAPNQPNGNFECIRHLPSFFFLD
ncbi:phospholipase D [Aspergillus luchuensis]|uniref:Phospholipase D n=1 Tax=Aspergillus kawachii TaxID=1069201 RepID=A0A146FVC0_ASPKA|nr:phospholipase D [Aspergillus luchuensis]